MKPLIVSAVSLTLFASLAACGRAPETESKAVAPVLTSGVIQGNIEPSVRPQDDFYKHINGKWLATTEIPADRSNYGTFTALSDAAEANLRTILEDAAASPERTPGSDAQRIGDFFASFMDEAGIEAKGLGPLGQELKAIDALSTPADIARYIGHTQRIGISEPIGFYVAIDERNADSYVSYVVQNGLGMPDRDYYLAKEPKQVETRKKYRAYVRDLLAAAEVKDADAAATRILALETRMADAQWTRVQNRDVEKTYNRYELAAAGKLTPGLDWPAFLDGAAAGKVTTIIVSQPTFFTKLGLMIKAVPASQWREYFRFKLLNAYAPYLPQRFVDLDFEFNGRTLAGTTEIKPRWKRGVATVESAVGDLVGKRYVELYFKPEAKQRMDQLVGNLMQAYSAGITTLEWMTPETREAARTKLGSFTTKIGYPDKWKDWSTLEVHRDDVLGNVQRAAAVEHDRGLGRLSGPIDKTDWLMTPQTVNAYYYPPANEIVFPAAILQPPFFDVTADDAVNYGAIGAVIGHEISHGFDDQGRHYDGTGNLREWWTDADDKEFRKRTAGLVAQYNAFSPLPTLTVNGELTLGENIADLSGLTVAYRAYRLSLQGKEAPVIDGYTGDQRFFIGWAQVWARKYRDDDMRRRILTDPHSPSEYRANGVLVNMPEFEAAFGLKQGDGLYRKPDGRIKIW